MQNYSPIQGIFTKGQTRNGPKGKTTKVSPMRRKNRLAWLLVFWHFLNISSHKVDCSISKYSFSSRVSIQVQLLALRVAGFGHIKGPNNRISVSFKCAQVSSNPRTTSASSPPSQNRLSLTKI